PCYQPACLVVHFWVLPKTTLFSEGDNVTFRCRGWEEGRRHRWFIKSNQTEGRLLLEYDLASDSDLESRLNISEDDGLLILSNVSLEDTGEYWCAVIGPDAQCVSSSRTVLKSREPSGMDFTLYTLTVIILIMIITEILITV
uniref:Ig-like domain-containing protein n=1 Tax=Sparus aurata TaxID=8175 RepID=A0A671UGP4_SPAAU